jgi:hypothetical protein
LVGNTRRNESVGEATAPSRVVSYFAIRRGE